MKSCIVLFTTIPEYWDDEKTRPLHSYMGSFCHKNPVYYVESYKNGNIKVTYDKEKAKRFTNDVECTKCMEQIIATRNPWTIAVWHYERGNCLCECVHYPNEHWKDNNNLQPSLMNRSITDFEKGL